MKSILGKIRLFSEFLSYPSKYNVVDKKNQIISPSIFTNMEIYLNSDLKIRVSSKLSKHIRTCFCCYISAINVKSFKQILDVYKCQLSNFAHFYLSCQRSAAKHFFDTVYKLSCSGIIRISESERAIKSHKVTCTLKYKSCFKLSISTISKAHTRIKVTDIIKDSLRLYDCWNV